MLRKDPCKEFAGERESVWERDIWASRGEEGRRRRRKIGRKSLKETERRFRGRLARKGIIWARKRSSRTKTRRLRARVFVCLFGFYRCRGSRWARACVLCACWLDELELTMRSDPVLFTSSRGECLRPDCHIFFFFHLIWFKKSLLIVYWRFPIKRVSKVSLLLYGAREEP